MASKDVAKEFDKLVAVFKRHDLLLSDFQGNGDMMSCDLAMPVYPNDFLDKLHIRIYFDRGNPEDFLRQVKEKAESLDYDEFCRNLIRKDDSLLDYPLEDLITITKHACQSLSNIINICVKDYQTIQSLESSFKTDAKDLHQALEEFKSSFDKAEPSLYYAYGKVPGATFSGSSGLWHVYEVYDPVDVRWTLTYNGSNVLECFDCEKDARLERISEISDDLLEKVVKEVQKVFPECKLSEFEQKQIKKNKKDNSKGR